MPADRKMMKSVDHFPTPVARYRSTLIRAERAPSGSSGDVSVSILLILALR
jgi:hypothetical protein